MSYRESNNLKTGSSTSTLEDDGLPYRGSTNLAANIVTLPLSDIFLYDGITLVDLIPALWRYV